jgi:hypothetical protein
MLQSVVFVNSWYDFMLIFMFNAKIWDWDLTFLTLKFNF